MEAAIHECETCVEMGKRGRKANRQIDGVWVCVECIVSMNQEEFKKTGMVKAVSSELSRPSANGVVLDPAPISTTKALVHTLSGVMDGLVKGAISPEQARAVCAVSTEWLKANELIWRMTK